MNNILSKQLKRARSHKKIRMKIIGTKERPRLCVFRSNQHIYAQLIDDEKGKVLIAFCDLDVKNKKNMQSIFPSRVRGRKTSSSSSHLLGNKKTDRARKVGEKIAKWALAEKINTVVFDRGGFVFHGRIRAVAEGAREAGLKF